MDIQRRSLLRLAACAASLPAGAVAVAHGQEMRSGHPLVRWHEAALAMKQLAQSWGDQPYGAVLVLEGQLVGEGPSRVVLKGDPDAHAEREAIRDAQRRTGRVLLAGSVLYSTSRPCGLCEAAAARAGVVRMFYGAALVDAGRPGADRP